VVAGAPTTWSPRIFENERLDPISRGGVPARCRLTARYELPELAFEKSRGFLRGFARTQIASAFSVAVGADSDADAGGADADAAATSLIAAVFDMTLAARSISV
jgi:hypothetical protein